MNLFQELKNEYQTAIIYHYLSRVYRYKGEANRAYDYMRMSFGIIKSRGDDYIIAITLLHLIPILIERGEYEEAKGYTCQC